MALMTLLLVVLSSGTVPSGAYKVCVYLVFFCFFLRCVLRSASRTPFAVLQWVPPSKSIRDKGVRGLRAVSKIGIYTAYTKSYILPTKGKTKGVVKNACFGL